MKMFEKCSRLFSSVTTCVKYHAPDICMIGGGALVVAGGIALFSAGRKVEKSGCVKNYKDRLHEIDIQMADGEAACAPAKEVKKARAKAKLKATGAVVKETGKIILPGFALTSCGLLLQAHGFNIMKNRYSVAAAGLGAALAANQELQEMVSTADENAYDILETRGRTEPAEKVDENGNTVVTGDVVLVTKLNQLNGPDFIYSQETVVKGGFIDDENYVEEMVSGAKNVLNHKLQRIDGYVFGEDVVKAFGVEPRPIDRVVGCCMPDPKYVQPGDAQRAGSIDISWRKIFIEYEDGSRNPAYLIKPKYDPGTIIDIYQNYSLNKFRVR